MSSKPPVSKPFLGFRKVFHVFSSSVVPLFYWFLPFFATAEEGRAFLLIVLSCALMAFLLFDGARLLSPVCNRFFMSWFSRLIRQSEEKSLTGATFTCLSFLLVVYLFSREIAVTAMLFLSLGDTAAEIVGKNWGRMKYFGRSLEGMGGFFIVALPLAWIVLQDWRVAFMGAAMGALIEFFSMGIDDNLTVPIGSAMALWLILSVI
jgi:glycerol-3-phosphate acyltransferase PlsY